MDPREYNYEQEFFGNSIGLKGLCQNKETKKWMSNRGWF